MSQKISQAEFSVMEVLWAESPQAASDIANVLAAEKKWNIKTIKTLLSRLVEKGALSTAQDGRRYLYSPEISRDVYSRTAARALKRSLVWRPGDAFGGSFGRR